MFNFPFLLLQCVGALASLCFPLGKGPKLYLMNLGENCLHCLFNNRRYIGPVRIDKREFSRREEEELRKIISIRKDIKGGGERKKEIGWSKNQGSGKMV